MGRTFEDILRGEPDRASVWSAEIEDLASSSGTQIVAFFGKAEFFDLTGGLEPPSGAEIAAFFGTAEYFNLTVERILGLLLTFSLLHISVIQSDRSQKGSGWNLARDEFDSRDDLIWRWILPGLSCEPHGVFIFNFALG